VTSFKTVESGIQCSFEPEDRRLLAEIVPMLEGLGPLDKDPAARRLKVPLYRHDPTVDDKLRPFVEKELAAARESDRVVFTRVVDADDPVIVTEDEASAFLRVVNEGRLAFAAKFGFGAPGDYDRLSDDRRKTLEDLGRVLHLLTVELSRPL